MPMIRSLLPLFCLLWLLGCGSDAEAPVQADPAGDELAQLTAAIGASPGEAELYAQRAGLFRQQDNFEAAIADLDRALTIDSTNIGYHYDLADVYMDYYRSRLALRTLERAATLDPDNVETQLRLAETRLILKQYDGALLSVNEAVRLDPRNPDAYRLLSQLYLETGDTTRALRAAEEVTQIDPDDPDAYITQGQLLSLRDDPRAAEYFDAAIAINPQNPVALHAKGDYLRDRGDLPAAIRQYRSASLADRQYVAGHFNAGLLLMELDSVEQALNEFNITVSNNPLHIRGFFFRGYAAEQLGDVAAARQDYRRALRMAPDYELALRGMERVGEE